jgi:hypothetical protein
MTRILALTVVLISVSGSAYAVCIDPDACGRPVRQVPHAHHCKHGVPCGNTCIAKGKTCHQPTAHWSGAGDDYRRVH